MLQFCWLGDVRYFDIVEAEIAVINLYFAEIFFLSYLLASFAPHPWELVELLFASIVAVVYGTYCFHLLLW